MEKFNIIQLLNKAETKVNSTMLSKLRKTEINLILLEIKKLAINYTHSCKSDSEQLQAVEDLKEFARNNCREWNVEEMEGIIDRL